MQSQFRSIRFKLLRILLLSTAFALLLSFVGNVINDIAERRAVLVREIGLASELLGRMTVVALLSDDQKLAENNLKVLQIQSGIHAAAVYDDKGRLFSSYAGVDSASEIPTTPGRDGILAGDGHLSVYQPIISDGVRIGTVYMDGHYHPVQDIGSEVTMVAVVSLMAMLVAFLMIARLERIVTRPILAIAKVAREVVAQRDYSRRAEKTSDDEVGELAESFNDMLSEIEARTRALEASCAEVARLNAGPETGARAPAPPAPAGPTGGAGRAHQAPAPREGGQRAILYVEDNPTNLRLMEHVVHFRGDLRMLSATDAAIGIELARAHVPDLILMDINLPGIDGHEALRILRAAPETAHIPVIAVTANAMPGDAASGLAGGFFLYLTKPINIDELNRAIDQGLAQVSCPVRPCTGT
jgi:CheY-like chemotaxis protein/HAMP domain-containing protein